MRGYVLRTLITAIGLGCAAWLIPGISFSGPGSLLLAAFLMGVVNGFVRPLAVLLTLPLTIVTFGLFLLVVNAAMLGLVAWFLDGFVVSGFLPALFGWLIVCAVSWLVSWFIGPDGRYQVIVIQRR